MRPISFIVLTMPLLITQWDHPRKPLGTGSCQNRDIHELLSADRVWKAIRFTRSCGGSDMALQVSVLRASESLPSAPGNALREKPATLSAELQLVWEKPRELWVMHNYEMTLEYSASQVGDITIVHTTRKLRVD
ncbi:MAG: hypothetical protein ACJ8R9_18280 [Steroidobacteraceae bacterium]